MRVAVKLNKVVPRHEQRGMYRLPVVVHVGKLDDILADPRTAR